MPIVSQAQRGAMYAAAEGKSTLGIPKSVGAEYVASDTGGKLPAHKRKSNKINRSVDYGALVKHARKFT
jgi:hypothetical protein